MAQYLVGKRLCLSFGGGGTLGQEDAVAERREAGAAVHLAHDALGLGIHALGSAVVERQGDGRTDGVAVLVKAAAEGHLRQSRFSTVPSVEIFKPHATSYGKVKLDTAARSP